LVLSCETTQKLMIFAFHFRNGTERLNDIHILDTATSTWTCPHAGGVLPHPRAGMTLTALRGRLYLFGGSGTSSKCFQDLQILDRSEMAWLDVTQYESTINSGRGHRYDTDPHQSENEDYNPRWKFGDYDAPGSVVSVICGRRDGCDLLATRFLPLAFRSF
jgi:hypothetical protein